MKRFWGQIIFISKNSMVNFEEHDLNILNCVKTFKPSIFVGAHLNGPKTCICARTPLNASETLWTVLNSSRKPLTTKTFCQISRNFARLLTRVPTQFTYIVRIAAVSSQRCCRWHAAGLTASAAAQCCNAKFAIDQHENGYWKAEKQLDFVNFLSFFFANFTWFFTPQTWLHSASKFAKTCFQTIPYNLSLNIKTLKLFVFLANFE